MAKIAAKGKPINGYEWSHCCSSGVNQDGQNKRNRRFDDFLMSIVVVGSAAFDSIKSSLSFDNGMVDVARP